MIKSILIIFCFCVLVAHAQDTTTTIEPEAQPVVRIDTVIVNEPCLYSASRSERGKIKWMYKRATLLDSVSGKLLRIKADSALKVWKFKYPDQSGSEKSKAVMSGLGTFQIIAGLVGLIVTIVDSSAEEKIDYSYDLPVFNSRGVQTGTKPATGSMTVKHTWTASHTALALLSGTFICSGIITVNF